MLRLAGGATAPDHEAGWHIIGALLKEIFFDSFVFFPFVWYYVVIVCNSLGIDVLVYFLFWLFVG